MNRMRSRGLGAILRQGFENFIGKWNAGKERLVKRLQTSHVNETYRSLNQFGRNHDKIEIDIDKRLISIDGREFKDITSIQKEFGTSDKNMMLIKLAMHKLSADKRHKCTIQLMKPGMVDSMVIIDDMPPLAFHATAMSGINKPIDQKQLDRFQDQFKTFNTNQITAAEASTTQKYIGEIPNE